ncbi:MAG: hypothetical protein U5N55_07755 [Cypionkella sp.]|nr:hypothetical protein [Cypionkella sp.]
MTMIRHSELQFLAILRQAEGGLSVAQLAATINDPYKTEVIWRRGTCKTMEEIEQETLNWADWFNNRGQLQPTRNIHA